MYPVQLDLTNKKIVIIGGGKIAHRKFLKLKDEPCTITVVSEQFFYPFKSSNTTCITASYDASHIKHVDIVFAATDNEDVNNQVRTDSTSTQLVNHTGDRTQSNFYNMMSFSYDDMQIHITSNGQDVKKSRALSQKIEQFLKEKNE